MDKIVESLIRKDYVEAKSLIENALGRIALNRINEMRMKFGKATITTPDQTMSDSPEKVTTNDEVDMIDSHRDDMHRHAMDELDKYNHITMSLITGQKVGARKAKEMERKRQQFGLKTISNHIETLQEKAVSMALDKHGVNDDINEIMNTAHENMMKLHPSYKAASEKHEENKNLFIPHYFKEKVKKEIKNRQVDDEIPFE